MQEFWLPFIEKEKNIKQKLYTSRYRVLWEDKKMSLIIYTNTLFEHNAKILTIVMKKNNLYVLLEYCIYIYLISYMMYFISYVNFAMWKTF